MCDRLVEFVPVSLNEAIIRLRIFMGQSYLIDDEYSESESWAYIDIPSPT